MGQPVLEVLSSYLPLKALIFSVEQSFFCEEKVMDTSKENTARQRA